MWEECRQRCNNWFSDASNSASPDSLMRHKVSLVGEETWYPFLGTRPRLLHVAVAHSQSYTIPTPCPVIPAGVVNYRLHFPAGPGQPMKGRRFNTESSPTLTWGPEISYTFQMVRRAYHRYSQACFKAGSFDSIKWVDCFPGSFTKDKGTENRFFWTKNPGPFPHISIAAHTKSPLQNNRATSLQNSHESKT